ncbi:peptidylprolyl isomerase [Phenylobacterium sp.]|uniref:peptidylprolyl isomerase n=1 Tax=Phenylobacterium sp. TaxID=1871053 RepID=UPI002B5318FB|nr:peptidylprolyl isomerase [Phenylobacterium sp.]HVI34302.1 peptidylprolyl isomerase [Phenylobacterium sp.]
MRRALLAAAAVLLAAQAPPPADWRPLAAENTLVVDTSKGRIVVEMRPEFAPLAVQRVKLLAREGVYDGLLFHRVIDGFVDQTGNPNNRDGGTSAHPDLPPEFTFKLTPGGPQAVVARRSDGVAGFVGATPFEAVSEAEAARAPDRLMRAWGAYCAGVVGMGRQADPGTANSEIFFMRAPARRLDRDYAVWGRVVQGLDVVRAIRVGEPPSEPDRMIRVRVAADLPPGERPALEVLNERGPAFARRVGELKARKGADFSVCDVEVPVRASR